MSKARPCKIPVVLACLFHFSHRFDIILIIISENNGMLTKYVPLYCVLSAQDFSNIQTNN